MAPDRDDAAIFHNRDPIRIANGIDFLADDDCGTIFEFPVQSFHNAPFSGDV